jgi:hypothetical protein
MKPNHLLAIAGGSTLAVISFAIVWIGDQGASTQAAKRPAGIPLPMETTSLQTEPSPRTGEADPVGRREPGQVRSSGQAGSPRTAPQPGSTMAQTLNVSRERAAQPSEKTADETTSTQPRWRIVDAPANPPVSPAIAASISAVVAPHSPAPIPLAFHDPPPAAAENPQIRAGLEELQQNFVEAIGGPNQDPADPEYLKRWITAQRQIDVQYRLLVGTQQFLVEQMQVNNQGN